MWFWFEVCYSMLIKPLWLLFIWLWSRSCRDCQRKISTISKSAITHVWIDIWTRQWYCWKEHIQAHILVPNWYISYRWSSRKSPVNFVVFGLCPEIALHCGRQLMHLLTSYLHHFNIMSPELRCQSILNPCEFMVYMQYKCGCWIKKMI